MVFNLLRYLAVIVAVIGGWAGGTLLDALLPLGEGWWHMGIGGAVVIILRPLGFFDD